MLHMFIGFSTCNWQGLSDSRKVALEMCRKMVSRNFVKQVTDRSSSLFSDSYLYYRFVQHYVCMFTSYYACLDLLKMIWKAAF